MTKNYFLYTPLYKIWQNVIDYVIPKLSFLVLDLNYQAGDVVCNRSGVHFYFRKDNAVIELYYNHPSRSFYWSISNKSNLIEQQWNDMQTNPENLSSSSLIELERVIDDSIIRLQEQLSKY